MNTAIQQPTVFIVDDDQAVRNSLVYFLEFEGMNVETYASARDFLDSVQTDWSGCLLLDVKMPGMSGLELQQILEERHLKIPTIFITGHGDVPMSVKAIKAGAVDFIEKPFDNEMLLRNIKEVMSGERPPQQNDTGNYAEIKSVNVAETVVETKRLPFLVLDENLDIVFTNRAFFEIFEVSTHGNEAILLEEFSHCLWEIPQMRERIELVMNKGVKLSNLEIMIDSAKIGRMTLLVNARQFQQPNVLPKRFILVVEDISQRKREEEMIFLEKERAQITLDSIDEAVITTDARGEVIHLNPVAEKLLGWSSSEARGQVINKIIKMKIEDADEFIADPVFSCLQQEKTIKLSEPTQLISRNDENNIFIECTASPIEDKKGTVLGAVLVLKDVTEQHLLNADLIFAASHDHLTGLVNRREFEERLKRAIESSNTQGSHHILCFIDLDKFKIINDTLGHAAGDELLRQVTVLFQQKLRERDTLARLGGDEFGLLLENCTMGKAEEITEAMVEEISHHDFYWDEHPLNIGASVGLVSITNEAKSPSDLMSQADVACYGAKRRGRSCVHIFHQRDDEHQDDKDQ